MVHEIKLGSSIPLPPDAGGAMPTPAEEATNPVQPRFSHGNEGYATLVWRRFKRSPMGMIGLVLVGLLLVV
jgi:peptide/nickel transport system permease protein